MYVQLRIQTEAGLNKRYFLYNEILCVFLSLAPSDYLLSVYRVTVAPDHTQ